METFGTRIKSAREIRGWSQEELGRRVAVWLGRATLITKATVNKWEDGSTRLPESDVLVALAYIFDTTPQFLLWGPDRRPPGDRARATPSTPKMSPSRD